MKIFRLRTSDVVRRLVIAISTLAMILLPLAPTHATDTINGQILSTTGSPIANATVTITYSHYDLTAPAVVKSDANGLFSANFYGGNGYCVMVQAPGYFSYIDANPRSLDSVGIVHLTPSTGHALSVSLTQNGTPVNIASLGANRCVNSIYQGSKNFWLIPIALKTYDVQSMPTQNPTSSTGNTIQFADLPDGLYRLDMCLAPNAFSNNPGVIDYPYASIPFLVTNSQATTLDAAKINGTATLTDSTALKNTVIVYNDDFGVTAAAIQQYFGAAVDVSRAYIDSRTQDVYYYPGYVARTDATGAFSGFAIHRPGQAISLSANWNKNYDQTSTVTQPYNGSTTVAATPLNTDGSLTAKITMAPSLINAITGVVTKDNKPQSGAVVMTDTMGYAITDTLGRYTLSSISTSPFKDVYLSVCTMGQENKYFASRTGECTTITGTDGSGALYANSDISAAKNPHVVLVPASSFSRTANTAIANLKINSSANYNDMTKRKFTLNVRTFAVGSAAQPGAAIAGDNVVVTSAADSSVQRGTTKINTNGVASVSFDNLTPGIYQVSVANKGVTKTRRVLLVGEEIAIADFTF